MRTAVSLIGALLVLAGCGAAPASPARGTDAGVITYKLVVAQGSWDQNGSRIEFVPPEIGFPPAPPAPLSGTFDVAPMEPLPPNTGFAFEIRRVQLSAGPQFSAGPYVVSGNTGTVERTTLNIGYPLFIQMTVSINGQQVQLEGEGSPDTFTRDSPPAFRGV